MNGIKGMKKQVIYLDNAATTKMIPEAVKAMVDSMENTFGNPSGMYSVGFQSKKSIDEARKKIAETINADPSQIFFTSGGTEGDNWIIKSVAEAFGNKGHHIITSSIEHKAVLNSCRWLEEHGYEVTYVDPDERGFIHVSDVESAIRSDTILVSIMFANNEIGTVQPIQEIAKVCHERHILLHTDAVQAYAHLPINTGDLAIDYLTTSSHKFHGPNGIGFAYIRDPKSMRSFIHGGQQECGLRAGTENVAGIVGFGKACEIANNYRIQNHSIIEACRKEFAKTLYSEFWNEGMLDMLSFNAYEQRGKIVNFRVDSVDAQVLLLLLDTKGVCVSAGSACQSRESKANKTLLAIGLTEEQARQSVRVSFSGCNVIDEARVAARRIVECVQTIQGLRDQYG